ncbi:MAG: signal peptidase I [bacterium]|nr:signal peptidase I [bacterium]
MYDYQSGTDAGPGILPILALLAIYAYVAFTQYKIAQKCGCHDSAWWAWIPIMNTFLLFRMAGKPAWWFVLCLIPLVNLYVFAVLWMETAKTVGQSALMGFLVLIPILNFIALGVLAFSGGTYQVPPPSQTERPRQPESVA